MRAAIYTRVSTETQAEEGFSLDAQIERLTSYCDSQGWEVYDIYTDEGMSAKSTDRPELKRMMSDIQKKRVDVVLVYKLDRLTRNVMDLHKLIQELERHGIGFKSATEVFDTTSAMGRLFITIVAALAQWERENLAERTKMGQIEMTRQGKWSGGTPAFGYDYTDGQLIVNESQAVVVRELFNRYISGHGMKKLLQWLNDPDHPQTSPRKRWTFNAIRYVLRNPLYAGYVRYGYRDQGGRRQKEFITHLGIHEPIIDEQTWHLAAKTREERSKMPLRSGTGTFPFSGVLRCGLCGSALSGRTVYRSTKDESSPRRYYVCSERMHKNLCRLPFIREEVIQEKVLSEIANYHHKLAGSKPVVVVEEPNVIPNIDRELEKVRQRRERWMTAFDEGNITSAELRERLDLFAQQEVQLKGQLTLKPVDESMQRELLNAILSTFESTWRNALPAEQRQLIRLLIKKITVLADHHLEIEFA